MEARRVVDRDLVLKKLAFIEACVRERARLRGSR